MRIGVLGTGTVGRTLGSGFVAAGHEVSLGSRTPDNDAATAWAAEHGERHGTFADATAFGEVLVNATPGAHSVEAVRTVADATLRGKVLLDVSNAMDTSAGFPPRLLDTGGTSVAEQLAAAAPGLRVVKTLSTVNAAVMTDPGLVLGEHAVFVAGDDADAKAVTTALLGELGWPAGSVVDLGGLVAARGLEAYILFWIAVWQARDDVVFNVAVRPGRD